MANKHKNPRNKSNITESDKKNKQPYVKSSSLLLNNNLHKSSNQLLATIPIEPKKGNSSNSIPVYYQPIHQYTQQPPVYNTPVHQYTQQPPVYNPPVYNPPVYNPPVYNPPVHQYTQQPPVYNPHVHQYAQQVPNNDVTPTHNKYIRLNSTDLNDDILKKIFDSSSSITKLENKCKDGEDVLRFLISPNETNDFLNIINSLNNVENNSKDLNDFINILKGSDSSNINNDQIKTETVKESKIKYSVKDDNKYDNLDKKYNSLDDLIKLGKEYKPELKDKYAFDYEKLHNIVEPLEELNNVIGMDKVKKSIVSQISYFLLELEPVKDMLHTVIQGPPGVGKTMLGQILAKIYHKMGIIDGSTDSSVKFKIYKRSDLIGQYLGHTAIKTQAAIDECMGGVMFIDEAYSLGTPSSEKSDIYSKECLDTLMQNLSERAGKFVCIIAGYADELEKNFFAANEGLKRRFTFRYSIDKYTELELARILCKKVIDSNWSIDKLLFNNSVSEELNKFIKTNYKDFPYFAGDIETFLFQVKVAHGCRIFGKPPIGRKNITLEDLENGFELFKKSKDDVNKTTTNDIILSMYS
jgi:SpoVK/Ycf46/Vps4 family AAA+-type ATPase